MHPLRILRVISHLDLGGVQRQMLLAFRELRKQEIEPEVCVLDHKGRFAEEFEREGFPVHLVRFHSRLDPFGLFRLNRLVHVRRIQVVHGQMYNANMAVNKAFPFRRGVKLVNGYHNQILVKTEHQADSVRRSARHPHAFLAVGNSVKESLCQLGVPAEKIHVVQNGVVPQGECQPIPPLIAGEPLRLIWAGRFVDQKKVPLLLDVMKECQRRRLAVQLTLLGDGPDFEPMKVLVEENCLQDYIDMPGMTHDVVGWLERSHLYVSASLREGCPNALLEASICGRPSLLSDIAPHREVLGDSKAGVLLEADPKQWAEAIEDIIRYPDRLREMSVEALRVGESYSIEKTAEKTAELYWALAGYNCNLLV